MAHQIFRGIAQLVEQRSPKPRAEGSSPSAPAIKRYQKRCNAEKARFIGLFLLPLSRILFYKIIDVFITFSKTIRTRTLNFKCYIIGSVTDILNTRNIITDVREKVPNLKRFGRHSSIAQSVEHAAVNRRVVGSSPTWGAT